MTSRASPSCPRNGNASEATIQLQHGELQLPLLRFEQEVEELSRTEYNSNDKCIAVH